METGVDGASRRGLPTAEIKALGFIVFIVGLGLMGRSYSEQFSLGCCPESPPDFIIPVLLMVAGAGVVSVGVVLHRRARAQ
jgi:drug/metabolite transporter (DMT)-like permease